MPTVRRCRVLAAISAVIPMGPGVEMMISVNPFALDVVQHLQHRREGQLLEFVLGDLELADGRESS